MTEHLTRHSADQDDDFTAREGDVREPGGADFREPDAEGTHTGDQNLSTADLASASAQPDTGTSADTSTDTDTRADTARPSNAPDEDAPPLIDEEKVTGFRDRWQGVQTGFVDDPQRAVREADELVAAVISALATTFAEHKSELEGQWQQGEPATEDLRVALRRYRSFFDQLLPR
jgi:hypothetical protein